jgi:hypothetical protein
MSNQSTCEASGGLCNSLLAEIAKTPAGSSESARYPALCVMFTEHSIPTRDRLMSSMRFNNDNHMALFSLAVGSNSDRSKAYGTLSPAAAIAYQELCRAIEAQFAAENSTARTSKFKVLLNYF